MVDLCTVTNLFLVTNPYLFRKLDGGHAGFVGIDGRGSSRASEEVRIFSA